MNDQIRSDGTTRAALYARVSSERQADKDLSIPAQLKALRDYAVRRGWAIHTEYVDEARSAGTADRPKFQEMISAAKQKQPPFNTILVWKLSRFARNREDSIIYKKLLRKHGVDVVSINEQIDDSPSGKLLEGIIEVIDEFYSANLSHDTIRGMKENARRGFLNGSIPPYGFTKVKLRVGNADKWKLAPDPKEVPVVRRIFKMCLAGNGAKEIARALNGEGLRTRRGRKWEINAIHYILRNETTTGVLIFNRVSKNSVKAVDRPEDQMIRVEKAHPAIIERDVFDRAQLLIQARSPRRVHPRTVTSNYLLSGFLFCGKCGANMAGCAAKSSRFFYYTCHNKVRRGEHGCSAPLINREKIERSIVAQLKLRVLTEENLSKLIRLINEDVSQGKSQVEDQLEEKDGQIEVFNGRLDKLYAALETGKLDMDDLAPRIKELRGQIEALKRARIDLELQRASETIQANKAQVKAYAEDLHALLEDGSVFERKSFLRTFIKRIDLDKPNGGTIEYTLPLAPINKSDRPVETGGHSAHEVLSFEQSGGYVAAESSPLWTIFPLRTRRRFIISRLSSSPGRSDGSASVAARR
ncbi:MAG: recombinase family protein [Elusimicrobia bacterium]|nr:recombinase family protein [Elusimicrobiota bacterium]